MPDPIEDFFHVVSSRELDSRLAGFDGTIRFNLTCERSTDHWLLIVKDANIRVSREERPADVVFTASRDCFLQLVRGEMDYLAAWLREQVRFEGNLMALTIFRALLPDRTGAHHPRSYFQTRGRS